MKKILLGSILILLALCPAQGQELFTEIQAKLTPGGEDFTFRVLGDKETSAFSAYGIHVIAPDGTEQMLDQFDSFLPEGSEVDALYVEDVNFDGFADLRIMKYLPGGANVPYLFWLYDPIEKKFVESKAFEVVMSPQVDSSQKMLISRQRSSAAEYTTEYYKPKGRLPVLVKREERTYQSDGSSVMKVYEIKNGSEAVLVETKNLGPEE